MREEYTLEDTYPFGAAPRSHNEHVVNLQYADGQQTGQFENSVLKVNDLAFAYGKIRILKGVKLHAPRGRVTCVMGRNGVGKTTLLKNIVGTETPLSGSIKLLNREVSSWLAHKRAKAGLSYVPQGRHVFPKLTVEENLQVGLEGRSRFRGGIPDRIYEIFPVLKEMARRMGGDLSGGQQQQLAIARALVGNPTVLLLDEPTEGVQPNIIQKIGEVIHALAKELGMAIVLVEQYAGFVREFGDDVSIMNRGRIVAQSSASELSDELVLQHFGI